MKYLKLPAVPVWGFTLASNREIYDASASVNFAIPEDGFSELVQIFLKEAGISTRDLELNKLNT